MLQCVFGSEHGVQVLMEVCKGGALDDLLIGARMPPCHVLTPPDLEVGFTEPQIRSITFQVITVWEPLDVRC